MDDPVSFEILRLEGPVVPAKLLEARSRAEELLARASQEAERIRGEAQEELEARCAAELDLLRAHHSRLLRRRRARLARADHLRRIRLCEAAAEACLSVAEQVWRQVPEERGPILRALAREMYHRAPAGRELELRCHPSDLGLLEEGTSAAGDPGLSPGDLVGHYEGGGLDGRASARAGQALDALAGTLGRLREVAS